MRRAAALAALALLAAGCTHRPPAAPPAPPPIVITRAQVLQTALAQPPGGGTNIVRVHDGLLLTLPWRALFERNSYRLTAGGQATLDRIAAALADGRERIVVSGLSDNSGNSVINRPQSLNRAAAIARYLIGGGVGADRITTIGLGSARPIASNQSADGRQRNRRIELLVQLRTP